MTENLEWHEVAKTSDLSPGEVMYVEVGNDPVALINLEGEFFALHDMCTHEDAPLSDGEVIGDEIECPDAWWGVRDSHRPAGELPGRGSGGDLRDQSRGRHRLCRKASRRPMTERDVSRLGGALGRENLLALIQGARPLISGYHSIEDQLQPNGFDLSVAEVGEFANGGAIGRTNASRSLPDVRPLPFDDTGWLELRPGPYQIVFNEIVDLPNNLMALGQTAIMSLPRSELRWHSRLGRGLPRPVDGVADCREPGRHAHRASCSLAPARVLYARCAYCSRIRRRLPGREYRR